MMSKSMSSIAEDYFCNLNPLAKRIGEDIKTTKDAYEELWNNLSLMEKNQAIDETIIQPEVALKYSNLSSVEFSKDLQEFYPKLRIQTGLKYILDETGSTLKWRDEHSGPFSFMTQSQMNLNLAGYSENSKSKNSSNYEESGSSHFASPIKMEHVSFESSLNDYSTASSNQVSFYQTSESYSDNAFKNINTNRLNNCTSNDNTGNIFTKLINKTSIMKINSSPDDDLESLVPQKNIALINSHKNINISNVNKSAMNINLSNARPKTADINESTALLETPSSYSSFQSSQTNQDDGIPKTGFEFLDNW
ncbi:hypothetical protein PV325_004576 [Microctonus aethiopoides]|uniref:DUF4706 domain-containing protein n=1 Tax=Microctonus aethiopoides TaxID=144406 RepID=A0AA39KXT0_9HYME|nr:hypothetical protein PV325_004576 [Microctonus aethiopoides]KAK0177581.1 hypothetical protein PV328_001619 [Microctonus aethiopoides]